MVPRLCGESAPYRNGSETPSGTLVGFGGGMIPETNLANRQTDPLSALCTNCVHDGTCLYQRTSKVPVIRCEQHETAPKAEVPHITIRPVPTEPAVRGLCATCDNFATCSLRSSEHIIHNCEHYR